MRGFQMAEDEPPFWVLVGDPSHVDPRFKVILRDDGRYYREPSVYEVDRARERMDAETLEQDACRRGPWACPCHSMANPPWPSGSRPAIRCPICDHPDLAASDMDAWYHLWVTGG